MPSDWIVPRIQQGLGSGERFEDFAYMFDTLIRLRQPYQFNLELSEEVTSRLLCAFVPDKPEKYRRAMLEFRRYFTRISAEPARQAEFENSIRRDALVVSHPQDIIWRPSLYFQYPGQNQEGWY